MAALLSALPDREDPIHAHFAARVKMPDRTGKGLVASVNVAARAMPPPAPCHRCLALKGCAKPWRQIVTMR
jgi:hypothetical protein